ncbi:unnamed protein product [Caenorhabditis auriculariae]|uniref:Acyltransferase n=1 Tax=Caenorhabditis auriculariae TaxID=2777116 RepID=A0A8S1HF16_9PELO|nr:unnamed protein product [Caenorhabditis auriculariae]
MRLRLSSMSKDGPTEVFSILFAPLRVSWKRRVEMLAVMHFIFLWIVLPMMSLWIPFYILFWTPWWWAMISYFAWIWYDWHTPRRGSRPWAWYKECAIWKHFAEYFPLKLVKTAELPPDRNYIIGSHPHGVLSVGAFASFLTTATGFKEKFPGINSTIMTLNGQFYFPFRREFGLLLGGVESSAASLEYLLKVPGQGRAVAIVLGGATEALDAHPGKHILNLSTRRGYCRHALKHGADLVPMYNFGENDIFEQSSNPRGSILRLVQEKIKRNFGFCPPLLRGRGVFNYIFGIIPHRKPITSVMGAPIRVGKVERPTEKQVDELHHRYCQALVKLFEDHKYLHNIPSKVHLTIN